jgi:hypothetical protein
MPSVAWSRASANSSGSKRTTLATTEILISIESGGGDAAALSSPVQTRSSAYLRAVFDGFGCPAICYNDSDIRARPTRSIQPFMTTWRAAGDQLFEMRAKRREPIAGDHVNTIPEISKVIERHDEVLPRLHVIRQKAIQGIGIFEVGNGQPAFLSAS